MKKTTMGLAVCLLACGVRGQEQLDLAGDWQFRADPANQGEALHLMAESVDLKDWAAVKAPCAFSACVTGTVKYTGAGWFRKEFTVPETWRGKRVRLTFEAVNNSASVWLNGQRLGDSEDAYLPFRFEVRDVLRAGGSNVLVVCANNRPSKTGIPYLGGWYHDGGILRGVRLEAIGELGIEDLTVISPMPTAGTGQVKLSITISNAAPRQADVVVHAVILDSQGNRQAVSERSAQVGANQTEEPAVSVSVADAKAWSPAHPALYTAVISLVSGGKTMDEKQVRFGFRSVEAKDGRVLLNGKPIYTVGFNRHEDTAETGQACNPEVARRDLMRMKGMGANFLRNSHYPVDSGILDLCDELGLLVLAEMPAAGDLANQDVLSRYLARRIQRDRNHPCIIYWSVSNESNCARVENNNALVRLAKRLDPTRLAVHVVWAGHPAFQANIQALFADDDVICLNFYPSEFNRIWRNNRKYDFAESRRQWGAHLEKLHQVYPAKPILVTEFGYPTAAGMKPAFDGADGAQMQRQAIEAEFAGFAAPYVCGATIWCWADHPWPKGQPCNETSPYGILTRDRQGKGAGVEDLLARLFRERLESRNSGEQ